MTTILGEMQPATFMKQYWQKKPLLIKGALPGFTSPLSRDELAGMAMEKDIESRLIRTTGAKYELTNGPFEEGVLSSLPPRRWTLLVQDVDKWLPTIGTYRGLVSFIPHWRFDDIMISFAADGGSVGPHIDLYDVFLLQAEGKRRWQIDSRPSPDRSFDPDQQLRVLRNFSPNEEWVLEPGDVLYLPPGVPHHGVAVGDCMTWSFGFRAPSFADLGSAILSDICLAWEREDLFSDPDLTATVHPGELSQHDLDALKEALLARLKQADWTRYLGEALSESKQHCQPEPLDAPPNVEDFASPLQIDPAARFGYVEQGQACTLFANGEVLATDINRSLCSALCSPELKVDWPADGPPDLLATLLTLGYLYEDR